MLNDAFITAFKIPNGLRKIFAEGAMSAAFVPSLSTLINERGRASANGLMSLSFLIFEGFVILLCIAAMVCAPAIITLAAPGFKFEAVAIGARCLPILMPFIFFISSSALFAGALQTVGNFLIPALAPVILNIVFIATLLICLFYNLPLTALCWGILIGGIVQFLLHIVWYVRAGFAFGIPTHADIKIFGTVLTRFILCLPSVSLMELSLFVDTSFASYLKPGSITLINLANRFVGIPLGVFAIAFATVLLPHFSRIAAYAPSRLPFYMLEGAKFVFFVTVPVMILMWYFSESIFETLFLSGTKFTMDHVAEAAQILKVFLLGLFFFSLNRVILNVYYALHIAWVPALISSIAALINVLLDWIFLDYLQTIGLALATTLSAVIRTICLLMILHYHYKQYFYCKRLFIFMLYYSMQALVLFIPCALSYKYIYAVLMPYQANRYVAFMIHNIGFWFWVGPLCLFYCFSVWYFQKKWGKHAYFLAK
jgi:putative peptidoglycan lipid II flippase